MKYDHLYLRKRNDSESHHAGLRRRPQFNEMIDYIELKQPKIKYPNRLATFFRNSPYGSQFDGDNSFINLEEQQTNLLKEKILQETIKKIYKPTQFFDMTYDDDKDEEESDLESEVNQRTEDEKTKQEKAKDLFSEATHKDDLDEKAEERMTAEKREASQEAKPAREKKVSKESHQWHKSYRSRSPIRADPAETEKIKRRISKKKPETPTDTAPASQPASSSKGKSPSKYPSLNKETAKEKVGGTIKLKQKGPTGAAAAAADEYEDDDDGDAGVYNIRPSVIGVQVLREILQNASNKKRLSWDDDVAFTRAINTYTAGVKAKDDTMKKKALEQMRAIYKKSFYKRKLI